MSDPAPVVSSLTCAPWIVADTLPCSPTTNPVDAAAAALLATDLLYLATGQRWPGACLDKVWPCGGDWAGCGYGSCGGLRAVGWRAADGRRLDCGPGCGGHDMVLLSAPVLDVVEVLVDGVALPDGSWRIVDRRWLLRSGGERWPCVQNLGQLTGVGTWSVEYHWGWPPPPTGQQMAGVLACELVKAWCGDGGCRLPVRVQSMVREGLTLSSVDPAALLARDDQLPTFAEVWEVGAWVKAVNPHGLVRPGRAIDPSRYAARRLT